MWTEIPLSECKPIILFSTVCFRMRVSSKMDVKESRCIIETYYYNGRFPSPYVSLARGPGQLLTQLTNDMIITTISFVSSCWQQRALMTYAPDNSWASSPRSAKIDWTGSFHNRVQLSPTTLSILSDYQTIKHSRGTDQFIEGEKQRWWSLQRQKKASFAWLENNLILTINNQIAAESINLNLSVIDDVDRR